MRGIVFNGMARPLIGELIESVDDAQDEQDGPGGTGTIDHGFGIESPEAEEDRWF